MPLLLAVEPDARQAASLTALVSAHVTADLVLATSVAEARDTLGPRRPDLVLTASSLSEADHAELKAELVAGTDSRPEVPTLAIPHLTGDDTASRKTRGLLARLRRPRARRSTHTCDPATFAAQINECLALADAVRRAYAYATTGGATQSRAAGSASALDLQVIVEPELAEEPVVDAKWLDLEPLLDDEAGPAGPPYAHPAEAEPESGVIELPPAGELWAQLAPGYAARMAPLEGPSMAPSAPHARTRDEGAGPVSAEAASPALQRARARTGSNRPMQDEWGLYDPEQCGFAALLVRLEELADDDRRERDGGNRSAIMRR